MRSERALNRLRALSLALAFLASAPALGSAEEGKAAPPEYDVKAAFVYNFVKFIEWPSAGMPAGESIRLCVLGTLPVSKAFSGLEGRQVQGRTMPVLAVVRPKEIQGCNVLFVAADRTGRLDEVLETLGDRPVLTIGDTEGFARRGIMINLFLENRRVRFEINEEKARAAGLRISVKLLKLASKVYGPMKTGEE